MQREEEQERKRELEKNRGKAFSRQIDDKDLNEDLKAQDRWNDPAAAFLTVCSLCSQAEIHIIDLNNYRNPKRKDHGDRSIRAHHHHQTDLALSQDTDGTVLVSNATDETCDACTLKTNTFLIDRGNGFEKKLFAAQNARSRRGAESHQWSVEDM